jgi:hypothetical protein
LVLVIAPLYVDGREDAPVVAKIASSDQIMDEYQRYETHVKGALPLQTARLEDPPTAPERSALAGLKYTLVASSGGVPQDLRNLVQQNGSQELAHLLQKELFEQFNKTWWGHKRAYRFPVWKEYDWLLPPLLVLDFIPQAEPVENPFVLKIPITQSRLKSRMQSLKVGDPVVLDGFVVQKVDPAHNLVKLAVGYGMEADKRAFKIEARHLEQLDKGFFRGEVIENLVARVGKTRQDMLEEAVRDLHPPYAPNAKTICVRNLQFDNPIFKYEELMDRQINGSESRIHGDLHLGNILTGPNKSIWLIDFGHTREGHTLFDWATLEISLLGDGVMYMLGDDWVKAEAIIDFLIALDSNQPLPVIEKSVADLLGAVVVLRQIVGHCLARPNDWTEYYIALAFCALRGMTFGSMSLGGRRLMFLLAALAMYQLEQKHVPGGTDTPSPDQTNITGNLSRPVPPDSNNAS